MAEGDRMIELEEVVELADAVAGSDGIATGMGTLGYGAQIVVEADSSDQAVDLAMALFTAAADRAGLPPWPITKAETIADEDELVYGFEDDPEGGLSGPGVLG
ncbi:MAG: hypothetical protein WD473_06270 [Acidimicrobiia bacterium]